VNNIKRDINYYYEKRHLVNGYKIESISLEALRYHYVNTLRPLFGRQLMPLSVIEDIYRANKSAFLGVFKESNGCNPLSICGIISLFPVLPETREMITSARLSGHGMNEEHLAPSGVFADSAYLSMGIIISKNIRDRAAYIILSVQKILEYKEVFSFPTTDPGLNVSQAFGMLPFHKYEKSELGVLHVLN